MQKPQQLYSPISTYGIPAERVSGLRYLAVHSTEDLTWTQHTNSGHQGKITPLSPEVAAIYKAIYAGTAEGILTQSCRLWFSAQFKIAKPCRHWYVQAEGFIHAAGPGQLK